MAVIGKSETLKDGLRRLAGRHRDELEGRGLPNGSPSALMICAAAMGCISMIRKLAELNKVESHIGLTSGLGSILWALLYCVRLCGDNPHAKLHETIWAAACAAHARQY